jgi:hypothetical protein
VSEKTRARIGRRCRRTYIVDEQDTAAVDPSSHAQCKGSADVLPSIRFVEANLRRSAPHPYHESGIDRQRKPPHGLAGEEESLVEAAATEPLEMERHRSDDVVIGWIQRKPIREERRERLG